MNQQQENEEVVSAQRRQMIMEMRRQKQKQMEFRRLMRSAAPFVLVLLLLAVLVPAGILLVKKGARLKIKKDTDIDVTRDLISYQIPEDTDWEDSPDAKFPEEIEAHETKEYKADQAGTYLEVGEEVISSHAVFIDLASAGILAGREYSAIIDPASMTKVLTLLVASEHIREEELADTFTITREITDYSYSHHCSSVGFFDGETVTVQDLFYGTILPSGADAALGLAVYVAGSHEAFVDMMNEKVKELGLSETTHITNCVGLYDEEHYSTVYDIAMILEAALDRELCRKVLSTHTYVTSETSQHPEGIEISNWFLRRIEDKDTGGEIICAKTGYVIQSGNCAASYGKDRSGKEYVCVTAGSTSAWRCIYDHVAIYKQFAEETP